MLNMLAEIARDTEAPPHERIAAADKVLDRAYGKPAQQVKAQVGGGGRFDWDKVPIEKVRVKADILGLTQRPAAVIDKD